MMARTEQPALFEGARLTMEESISLTLDSLLDDEPTHADLEREALEQTRRDFLNPEARSEWDYIETMGKIALAMSRSRNR